MSNATDVKKAVDSAIKGAKSARDRVQKAINLILIHAKNHGDYSEAQRLVDGIEGMNRVAVVAFFVELGGLVVTNGKFSGWSGAKFIVDNTEAINSTKFWEFKPDRPFTGFDLNKRILALVAQAERMAQDAANDPEKAKVIDIDVEKLTALRALAS